MCATFVCWWKICKFRLQWLGMHACFAQNKWRRAKMTHEELGRNCKHLSFPTSFSAHSLFGGKRAFITVYYEVRVISLSPDLSLPPLWIFQPPLACQEFMLSYRWQPRGRVRQDSLSISVFVFHLKNGAHPKGRPIPSDASHSVCTINAFFLSPTITWTVHPLSLEQNVQSWLSEIIIMAP